jgi:hypothetical protein
MPGDSPKPPFLSPKRTPRGVDRAGNPLTAGEVKSCATPRRTGARFPESRQLIEKLD